METKADKKPPLIKIINDGNSGSGEYEVPNEKLSHDSWDVDEFVEDELGSGEDSFEVCRFGGMEPGPNKLRMHTRNESSIHLSASKLLKLVDRKT